MCSSSCWYGTAALAQRYILIGSQTLNPKNAETAQTPTPTTYPTTLTKFKVCKFAGFCETLAVRTDDKYSWGSTEPLGTIQMS